MGERDEFEGKKQKVAGRIEQAVGAVTGDRRMEAEGAAERTEGRVRESYGSATSEAGGRFEKSGGGGCGCGCGGRAG